jgi:hypothetical protein
VDEFDITIFGQTGTRQLEAARLRASLTGGQPDGNVGHDEAPARMRAGASSSVSEQPGRTLEKHMERAGSAHGVGVID